MFIHRARAGQSLHALSDLRAARWLLEHRPIESQFLRARAVAPAELDHLDGDDVEHLGDAR
jgi:hypothetical protein